MRPCTPLHSTSPICARAARMSSVERSTTISPDAEVSGGHDSRGVAAARSRRRLGRHVGEGHALDLGGDAEIAVARHLRVVEREVPEIAADAEGRARDRSFAHRAGDVVAHALRQAERQVARRARSDAVDELAVELELARVAAAAADAAAGARAPGRGQVALGVGVGEARRRDLDAQLRRRAVLGGFDLPAELRVEPVERHLALLEHAGQVEPAGLDVDARLAAGLGRLELQRRRC